MKAYDNKYLIVPKHIILNEKLDEVLCEIDEAFKTKPQKVTSGVRTPKDQIRIIKNYLVGKKLDKLYPDFMASELPEDKDPSDASLYVWQTAWSHLLSIGLIINPPLEAKVLMDYIRNGTNKKGQTIGQSPHTRGTAFDMSGITGLDIIHNLLKAKLIRNYLLERENNCIHVDI